MVLLFLAIGVPFKSYFVLELLERRRWKMMRTVMKNLKKDSDVYLIALNSG